VAKAKAKKLDPLALIASKANKPKKSSKSKTPTVTTDDENIKDALQQWVDAKEMEKQGKSSREMVEELLRPFGMEARRALIQRDGAHTSAVRINNLVTMKTSKAYSAISTDSEDELREVFGDDYDKYFSVATKIEFTAKFAQDPEILGTIIEAVGADKFHEIFDVSQAIVPNDSLITDRDLSEVTAAKHDKAVDDGLIKPYKSSFVRS
jgi:hypothetical protein